MSFPLGKPVATLLAIALLAGGYLLARTGPRPSKGGVIVWTFAPTHAAAFRDLLPPGDVHLVNARALDARLMTLLMADAPPEALPDLVQLEINAAAKFLRGGPEAIGLLPLENRLAAAGLLEAIPPARLAAWSRHGHLYAVPWDLHPVALAYRRDLFAEAGIDMEQPRTWRQLHAALQQYRDWRETRDKPSDAIELNRATADHVTTLLLQRGVNLVDAAGRVYLNDPRTHDVVCRLALMTGGQGDVSAETPQPASAWVRQLAAGRVAACLVPDWRLAYLPGDAPELSGKIALRPLPVFDAGDAPTSTWGGIGMAIPANARDPDAAFDVLVKLLASDAGLAARRVHTDILPPIRNAWSAQDVNTAYFGPDATALMAHLAERVPQREVTVHTPAAAAEIAHVLNRAAAHLDAGGDESTLGPLVARMLAEAQQRLERRIARTAFNGEAGE